MTGDRIPFWNQWGTTTFTYMRMKDLIGIGTPIIEGLMFNGFDRKRDPHHIHFGPWLSFVPECYTDQCRDIAVRVFEQLLREGEGRMQATDATVDIFIVRIQDLIISEVKPK